MPEPFGTTPLPIPFDGDTATAAAAATATSEDPNSYLHVTYDPSVSQSQQMPMQQQPQQPMQQQIAAFEAERVEYAVHGATALTVNQHFVVYAVKNGLIRVLHRHSTIRALLRAHQNETVSDLQFFQDGDVLATVGSSNSNSSSASTSTSSKVIIWRVFERSPDILSEQLLEIRSDVMKMTRVVWHPFNPNQFWMFHSCCNSSNNSNTDGPVAVSPQPPQMMATLVETTRITTTPDAVHSHAVANFHSPTVLLDGGIVLQTAATATRSLLDLAWSGRDTRYVLAGYDNGDIVLYDVKSTTLQASVTDGSTTVAVPTILQTIRQGSAVTRCLFLPHEQTVHHYAAASTTTTTTTTIGTKQQQQQQPWTSCFVTGSENNSVLTLWSAFTGPSSPPEKIQVLQIAAPPKNNNNAAASATTTPTLSSSSSSYILNVCFGPTPATAAPPACFVTACSREQGAIYAFHIKAAWSSSLSHNNANNNDTKKALLAGSDYVVPFATKFPVYSCTVTCAPATDISEEELSEQGGLIFDMKLFCYQSNAVQCLTLTSFMCLPPASTYTNPTPGVHVRRVTMESSVRNNNNNNRTIANAVSDLEDTDEDDFEDYDVDDDEDDDDDDSDQAPDPSSLPVPGGVTPAAAAAVALNNNPFANWLGAIAAKTTAPAPAPPTVVPATTQPLPPPPPAPPQTMTSQPQAGVTPPPPPKPSFLSPMEILATSKPASTTATPVVAANSSSRQATPTTNNTDSKKKKKAKPVKTTATTTAEISSNVAILQRNNSNIPPAVAEAAVAAEALQPPPVVDHAALVEEIRRLVRDEMRTTVVPGIRQAVADATAAATNNKPDAKPTVADLIQPLQASIEALSKQGVTTDSDKIAAAVAASVQEPLRAAFADSLKIFLPTLESVTGQVLQQVSEHLDKASHINDNKLESISKQLTTMTQLVAELTKEVHSLRASVASTRAAEPPAVLPPPPPAPVVDPVEAQRAMILALLKERNFEEAFTKAVSNPTVEMTIFCCRSADLQEVLGGAQPVLSQPILLCLMQQLGTVLVTSQDPQLELEWLQEIALSLNPIDPSIQRHVPNVLQQVVTNINQRMQQSNDPLLRRPLQRMLQVVRGMQLG